MNGDSVHDASNESFKFYSDTRCIYSVNQATEYTNFCLSPGSANVLFQGQAYQVLLVRNVIGSGCLTALADTQGHVVDMHTEAGNQEFLTVGTQTWDTTGCT